MRLPTQRKLVPLAMQYVKDHRGYKVNADGSINNRKHGLYRIVWGSMYELGITLYKGGMIERKGAHYRFASSCCGLKYPYRH